MILCLLPVERKSVFPSLFFCLVPAALLCSAPPGAPLLLLALLSFRPPPPPLLHTPSSLWRIGVIAQMITQTPVAMAMVPCKGRQAWSTAKTPISKLALESAAALCATRLVCLHFLCFSQCVCACLQLTGLTGTREGSCGE